MFNWLQSMCDPINITLTTKSKPPGNNLSVKPQSQLFIHLFKIVRCFLKVANIATALYLSQNVDHKCTCMFCDLWRKYRLHMHTPIDKKEVQCYRPPCWWWDLLTYVSSPSNGRQKLDVLSHTCGTDLTSFGHTACNLLYSQRLSCWWHAMH